MSYTADRSSSRLAAAALFAVSAGAVCGLALSFTPVASSLYAAPTAVRTVAGTRVAAVNMPAQMQAMSSQYAPEQFIPAQYEQVQMAAPTTVNTWTVLSGGVLAAAAAMVAMLYKKGSESSEQIAMLAAAGKKSKSAPKAAASSARPLWYPAAEAPAWLDGSLPGDRGFDPLGLAKPTEYLQFDLDSLDQNKGKNPAGRVVGRLAGNPDTVSEDAFQPYSEVFGLQRFRECELQHGRWAMLGALGVIIGEAVTGIAWQDAGLYEATNGATYWGNSIPFTGSQITWFEVLAMGTVEVFRNRELNIEKRCYPGGFFDPLSLAKANDESTFRLKEAELKHGRLAMIAFLGFAAQALSTGQGATQGFREWALSTWG